MRFCTGCEKEKIFSEFYVRNGLENRKYQCRICENKKAVEYRKRKRDEDIDLYREREHSYLEKYKQKNPNAIRDKHYRGKYNITFDDVVSILSSQMGLCANRACGREIFVYSKDRKSMAVVDHDHSTGKVRGILCNSCNVALGHLEQKNKVMGLTEYLHSNLSTSKGSN